MLPAFTEAGLLPPGEYALSIRELRRSMLVRGPAPRRARADWDAVWRGRLVSNLAVLLEQLAAVGITDVFIDGSFVEDKDR